MATGGPEDGITTAPPVAVGLVAMPAGILAAAFSDTFQRQARDDTDESSRQRSTEPD